MYNSFLKTKCDQKSIQKDGELIMKTKYWQLNPEKKSASSAKSNTAPVIKTF